VIDAVDLMLAEHRVNHLVQFLGALQVDAERLFDHHAARTVRLVGQTAATELFDGGAVELWRRGEIVDAGGRRPLFKLAEELAKRVEVGGVTDIAGVVEDVRGEHFPSRHIEFLAGVFLRRLGQLLSPLLVTKRRTREANDLKAILQPLLAVEFVERRNQLATRQIA
jgi:hypothetical protein